MTDCPLTRFPSSLRTLHLAEDDAIKRLDMQCKQQEEDQVECWTSQLSERSQPDCGAHFQFDMHEVHYMTQCLERDTAFRLRQNDLHTYCQMSAFSEVQFAEIELQLLNDSSHQNYRDGNHGILFLFSILLTLVFQSNVHILVCNC